MVVTAVAARVKPERIDGFITATVRNCEQSVLERGTLGSTCRRAPNKNNPWKLSAKEIVGILAGRS